MHRLFRLFNQVEEWTLVFVLLGLAVVSAIQVFCRYVLDFSFPWMEEVARYVGVFVTFLGASLGVKYGVHFTMDLLYERVDHDRFRNGVQAAVNFLSALLFLVVAWYGWEHTMKLRGFGVKTAVLELPKYWTYLPVPVFSAVMSFRFSALGIRYLAKAFTGASFAFLRSESP